MRLTLTGICLLIVMLGAAGSSWGATSYGHFILARETLRSGRDSFPPELKSIIDDPECQKAFYGGSMAPDIAENFGHYGKTADAVQKMLGSAREHLATAQRNRDASGVAAARQELAFSYGWLCHYGTDLNVHPAVNAFPVVGDAFAYLDKTRQIAHGAIEVQLDAYLVKTYGRAGPNWMEQFKIPWSFLAEQSDEFKVDLQKTAWWGNLKNAAGIAWMQNVTIDPTAQWADVVKASLQDSRTFIHDPKQFQNWDLCVGRMSTEEFAALRAYEMCLNGGKLPEGWGRNYMQIRAGIRAEWAKAEEASRRFNHQLPPLPTLKFDTLVRQVNDWLAACLDKLEKDKLIDPARLANRDACLAFAARIQAGGNKLYCPGCKTVTAQYWCPKDPDLGDHWMCGCSGVTQLSQLKRPDGKTFNQYASERIAVYDAMAAQLRTLANRLKNQGLRDTSVRHEINQFIAAANGQGPLISGSGTGSGGATGTGTSGHPTTTTQPGTSGSTGHGTTSGGQGHSGQGSGSTGGSHGSSAPAAKTTITNPKYGFSLQIPGGWQNDPVAAGEEVTQRVRLKGSPATLVEVTRVATGGLSLEQLRQVARKIMAGNAALAQKTQERPLEVPNGSGLDAVYTGTKAGLRILSVVRFISIGSATYVIAGTVPANATDAQCKVVSGIIESFRWPTR
jgi:hypothetical protein